MNWLEESFKRRKPLLANTNVFRAIHRGEAPDLDIAVDIYGNYFCAMIYSGSISAQVLERVSAEYSCRGGVIKFPQKDPHKQGWVKDLEIAGERPPSWFEVTENNLRFKVTLTEKQHTGLFLDQRDNRAWVHALSKDALVANLFSYTCSFSVAAAHAGAKKIHSVDISKAFLDWGKENFVLNNLKPEGHYFFADDVRDWLDRRLKNIEQGKEPKFDLIICDPPSFAQGSKNQPPFKVEREWPNLCAGISKILNPNGKILFSNNLQERPDKFFKDHMAKFFSFEEVPTQTDFVGTFHARYFRASPQKR